MLGTLETQLIYVPLSQIVPENDYGFRLPYQEKDIPLRNSLLKSGQTHPLLLEEANSGQYRILDGHRRYNSVMLIRNNGGTWEKMLGHIIPEGRLSATDRFRMIKELNFSDDNAFGLYEKGCFFKKFVTDGLSIQFIAAECALSIHSVEDYIELSAARAPVRALINHSTLEPVFALMLHHRFESWLQSEMADKAEAVAQRILDHAKQEKPTMKSWRFLLDFYWRKDRPFLHGRLKNT